MNGGWRQNEKKPNLSIGLNWVHENEFLEGPKETTGFESSQAG